MTARYNSTKTRLLHALFVLVGSGIVLFLWFAPQESTPHLPMDDTHAAFFGLDKKAAEKHCESCHNPEGVAPLPANHPPKYRCLFCHKRK